MQHKNGNETTDYYYSGGTAVAETKTVNGVNPKTTLFYRGSDMGGGVGGINYAEYSDGSNFNYKFYNLRGDVVVTLDSRNAVKSASHYYAFGTHDELGGSITTDKHRANTKVEDSDGLLNEGHRFRSLEHGVFLTPDPLEYVDGLNMYVYVGQNPWGRFDPLGLFLFGYDTAGEYFHDVGQFYKGYGLAIQDTAVGAYHMVRHPVDTAVGIKNAAMNPVETGKAIANSVSETWNSGSEGQGRVFGHALIAAGMAVAPMAEAGNAVKVGQAVKTAEAMNNATKLKPVIVIGEDTDRVVKRAGQLKARGVEAETFTPNSSVFKEQMAENGQWIQKNLEKGAEIHDVGPSFMRRVDRFKEGNIAPSSPFYELERTAINRSSTTNYIKEFSRKNKLEGASKFVDDVP